MSLHGTIHRYSLLIEKIGGGIFPGFREIRDMLHDKGFEISPRTLQRDIEKVRFEFGVEITYSAKEKGYYINKEESPNLDSFLRLLEILATADLFSESLKEKKDTLNFVSFEAEGNFKGLENLRTLLSATRNRKKISFIHENFATGKRTPYELEPYLLKEYQNRWYVVGIVPKLKAFRTFGIDRIEDLTLTKQTFTRDSQKDPRKLFEDIIGLTYSDSKVEEVILTVSPLQGKYLQSLPLHRSQKILSETKKETRLSIKVRPNYELIQKIWMMGKEIKVLSPNSLVKRVRNLK